MNSEDTNILFVLGGARSGTTYINGLLDEFCDYGMGPEGSFVAEFYSNRERYGDLHDDSALDCLINDISRCKMLEIMRSKWSEEFRVDVTTDMIKSAISERTYAGVVFAVFQSVARIQNKSRVGNKWPDYWRHLSMLNDLFGDRARYLFVVRDGRDVALSTMKVEWGESTSYACARSWAACCDAVQKFEAQNPDARVMKIRYEDVLDDPTSAWLKLECFLGSSRDPERGRDFVASVEDNQIRNNTKKWRNEMSGRDIYIYEAVAGKVLAEFGYELTEHRPQLSTVEELYYDVSEFLRKVYRTIVSFFS